MMEDGQGFAERVIRYSRDATIGGRCGSAFYLPTFSNTDDDQTPFTKAPIASNAHLISLFDG